MSAAYEGGSGGKFPKRSSRRAPATPYDRPPAAARGLLRGRHAAAAEPGGSGWFSKLVDPASRIIARSASRLFPSVFRTRLAGPPAAPEGNLQSRQEVPEVPSIKLDMQNSSSEVEERYGHGGENPKDNHDAGGAHQEINPDSGGISELEELLKQKTFTRVEFERLTELLHSRTIEPSTSQRAVNHENEGKANISEQRIHKVSTAEPSTSQPMDNHDQKEKANVPEQEAVAPFRLHGSVTAFNFAIPEETASPAEIAKTYMGSRSSKVSPSTLRLRSQILQKDAAPYAKKSFDMAIAPRLVQFSGSPELKENGYTTPRPHGRSAMYRMSRSPYFKAHAMTDIKGGRPVDGNSGPSTSSQWTSANISQFGSKLALKQGSSNRDSDVGSLGPIRRICRKSRLMSPSRNIHSSLSGNLLPTPSSPLRKGASQGCTALNREPLHLDEPKYGAAELQDAENGNRIPSVSFASIPPRSSEMAGKILQQLDKLVPSPEEKSSELKIINRDDTRSKSMKVQVSGNMDVSSSSHLKSLRNSTSQKQERTGENGPLKPSITGTQLTSEAVDVKKSVIYATDAKPGMRSADFAFSVTAAVPSQNKPSFQMSAPEDSLDSDDDNYFVKDASGLASSGDDKYELISACKKDHSGNSKKSPGSLSKSMPSSTLILDKRAEAKASDSSISEKHEASLLPAASPFKTSSQIPSPPVSTTLLERSTPQKEEVAGPTFKFGFKEAQSSTFSLTTTAVSNPASPNFGVSNDATPTLSDGSNSDKERNQNAGDAFKSVGNAASLGLSSSTSPALFSFGASATPTLSNCSLSSASISSAPAMTSSDGLATSIFSDSVVTSTSSSSPSSSSAIAVCPMVPSFQFGSGASTDASTSVEPSPNQPVLITFDSAVSFSSTGSNNSASATSSVFSSMGTNSSSVVQESPLFSSTSSGSMAPSTSSVFTDNGFFASTASAHFSSEKLSFANSSSQTLPFAFGATDGSNFNTQATQSGNGVSTFLQSSPSQFDTFTSQPIFGLSGSSSSGLASSLFGSATPATKSFATSSIFSFSTSSSSSSSTSSVSFTSTAPFGTSAGFSFSSGTISSSSSGGSTSFAPVTSGFPFSNDAGFSSSSGSSSSFASRAADIFSSSSQPSTSSIFYSTFGSTTPLPSPGFSFGFSAPSSASSIRFGTSSGSAFSFTSAGATTTSPLPSGVQNPAVSFSSGVPRNDQMNVDDSMADDANQASAPVVPIFGQQTNLTATPNFMLSSPAAPSSGPSVFQSGSQQNASILQGPSPFQMAGSLEFTFGSGGGDKSGRKFMRVRRDKHRKK